MQFKIVTDWNNPYPIYTEFYKHELDQNRILFFFTRNGEPFDLWLGEIGHTTEYEAYAVTGVVTIDNKIITEELTPVSAQYTDEVTGKKGFAIDLSEYELFAGLMKIEFKFTDVNALTNNVTYAISPILINITPSILDNASAIPESVGSVSEMLQLYPDLKSFVDNGVSSSQIADGAVTDEKLATARIKYFVDGTTYYTAAQLAETDFIKYDTVYSQVKQTGCM